MVAMIDGTLLMIYNNNMKMDVDVLYKDDELVYPRRENWRDANINMQARKKKTKK